MTTTAVLDRPGSSEIPVANILPATRAFPDDAWLNIPNVPVFSEHETQTSSGRQLAFGREELAALCENCNRRIRETGDYAGVIVGHTPDPADAAGLPPMPLIGLAGPFRLGQIRQHGGPARWAILADFHIQRNQSHLVKQFPRRSAELWVEDAYEDMYLDPIALLGAETPRLDMGLLYSAVLHRGGRQMEIEKYSACAPSATSVFVPSDTVRKPYRAAAEADDSTPTIPVMEITQMTPEDIKQIVDALEQLDWVQWVKGQMLAKGPGGDVPPIAPEPDPEPPATEPAPPIEPTPEPAPEPPMPLTEGDEDTLPVKYSRLSSQVAQLKRELEVERGRIEEERSRRVNTERYAALADCRRTRLFDLDSEFELVRYGRMSDEQFSAHIDRITANYREIPIDLSIPTFDLPARLAATRPGGKAAKEKYSKEVSDKALAIAKRKAMSGEPVSYEEVLEQVATGKL